MKVVQIDGVYEEGQVKLSRPAPVTHSKVFVNFIQKEKKSLLMNEEIFRDILSQLDFDKTDSGEIIKPSINKLMDFSSNDFYQFEEILAQKLYAIDGKEFYYQLLKNPSLLNDVEPFESIQYIAERAYKSRVGMEMPTCIN